MNAHFTDALADGSVVAKIAFHNSVDANDDACLGLLVTQPSKPAKKNTALNYLVVHRDNCLLFETYCQEAF